MNAGHLMASLGLLGLFAAVVPAGTVNVDFKSTNNSGGTPYTGLAVAPDAAGNSAYWNPLSNNTLGPATVASSGGLLESDQATNSGIDISVTTQGGYAGGGSNEMLDDYVYSNNNTVETISITGLASGTEYDIYIYSMGDVAPQGGKFTLGTTELTTSNDPREATNFIEGRNYVVFSDITGVTNLAISWTNNGVDSNTGLNGIQIVSQVPEPASMVLASVFAGGLLARRRRA